MTSQSVIMVACAAIPSISGNFGGNVTPNRHNG
jgi:hypothetical protein